MENLGQPARIDLVLLGMGEDGHVASLFQDTGSCAPGIATWRSSTTRPSLLRGG